MYFSLQAEICASEKDIYKWINKSIVDTWGSHSSEDVHVGLWGSCTIWTSRQILMFQMDILPPSSALNNEWLNKMTALCKEYIMQTLLLLTAEFQHKGTVQVFIKFTFSSGCSFHQFFFCERNTIPWQMKKNDYF